MAALNLTRPSGGSGSRGTYRRPQSRYNRPKSNNPNLDLNGEGGSGQVGNTVANAALDAGEVSSNAARQSALETQMMREELGDARQARITALAQQARGESPEAQAAQTRGIQMRDERDTEAKKRQFRATAETMANLKRRMGEAKDGMIKIAPKDQAPLMDMIPGFNVQFDREGIAAGKGGKMKDVIVRMEPSGEAPKEGGEPENVLAFYTPNAEGGFDAIKNPRGNPVRVNTKVAKRMAELFDIDEQERTGFPGTERKRDAEKAAIDLARSEAIKNRASGGGSVKNRLAAVNADIKRAQEQYDALEEQLAVGGQLTPEQQTQYIRLERALGGMIQQRDQLASAGDMGGVPRTSALPAAVQPAAAGQAPQAAPPRPMMGGGGGVPQPQGGGGTPIAEGLQPTTSNAMRLAQTGQLQQMAQQGMDVKGWLDMVMQGATRGERAQLQQILGQ